MEILKNSDYKQWISELKLRIQQSQIKILPKKFKSALPSIEEIERELL